MKNPGRGWVKIFFILPIFFPEKGQRFGILTELSPLPLESMDSRYKNACLKNTKLVAEKK